MRHRPGSDWLSLIDIPFIIYTVSFTLSREVYSRRLYYRTKGFSSTKLNNIYINIGFFTTFRKCLNLVVLIRATSLLLLVQRTSFLKQPLLVYFSNSYSKKRLISIEGRYNISFSSSFRGLLLIPLISILTILLSSSIVGPLAINIVYNNLLFRVYNLKFIYIYIIYNTILLLKYQKYQSSFNLVKRVTIKSTSLLFQFLSLEGFSLKYFIQQLLLLQPSFLQQLYLTVSLLLLLYLLYSLYPLFIVSFLLYNIVITFLAF